MSTKKSMKQHVYQTLKDAILSREIAPGSQLVEQMISEKLNVSRTPIRNAILQLEKEGLVTIYANRGAFVTLPTTAEIEQAYVARKKLEQSTAELAVVNVTEKDIERLRRIVKKERESYQNKDILEYLAINKEFHLELAKISGNKFLIDFIDKLLNQINVFLMLYDVFYDVNIENSQRYLEHEAIVDALEDKDIDRLQLLFQQHMKTSMTYMNLEEKRHTFFGV
ncbi:hypothetical protein BKP35_10025 [Anaerobacillus arseniciselenatis]|uniref:HTH gntR-type domain-containing protein n=1 Tax=Anaerobacillus arseniciselenatis TaxID=85682 RepID=A0A1S2LK51_9BACI|nr:GntR family transcriptional regulator [Anaerobacillus arseniciselenatis]OIJ12892.1 hypothetical protein BKP35_10025 [Anaerobacillus arseniciselenatis]